MPTLAKRVVGALLALLGLVLTVFGLWYAVHLGGSGTATFSTAASGTNPVLVPQTVLNRVDGVVKVTVTPAKGGTVWLAAASPSDAKAVLGKTAHTTVDGVSTRPWELETSTTGTGATPSLAASDVWRNTDTGEGAVSMTIEQANAPETVIAQASKGEIERVDLTWQRKSWFVQSVIAALVGLFLLLSGLSLLWSSRHARPATSSVDPTSDPEVTATDGSAAATTDGSAAATTDGLAQTRAMRRQAAQNPSSTEEENA
ncbi:hypothetical protein [Knoellia subterranea]|uniref:Uncharacterized protein n=1 Tax=Knoellia subterranea KCTC 19937 TaxID=1385521 RepID=A0A0A0JSC9_9MICO|nr:hypothetical protein [Knoellia subterranea]KGN39604.1 hypothetical protein N803_02090 [Knoellia subterranea KCTC 19937]